MNVPIPVAAQPHQRTFDPITTQTLVEGADILLREGTRLADAELLYRQALEGL